MSKEQISGQDKKRYVLRLCRVVWGRFLLFFVVLGANLRFKSALTHEWRSRFVQARRDFLKSDPLLLPSRQWGIISLFYRLVLRGMGLTGFKRTFGRFLAAYEPGNPRLFEALHHLYFSALKKRDSWGLLCTMEEPSLGDGDVVLHGGRRLSLDLLQSIDEFYRLQETLGFKKDDPLVFCELGAGYGRLAEVILSAMPNAKYLVFDLPEPLVLSQYYLSTLHPEYKVSFYPESAGIISSPAALSSHKVVFGLPHQLGDIPANYVDVFINIYSFMEMSAPQVQAYFNAIERLNPAALYLKQHKYEVNLMDGAVHTSENYPIRPSWRRGYHDTSVLYENVFESVYLIKGFPASARP